MSKLINNSRVRQFRNTRQDDYWFTSDDMPFYKEADAVSHAKGLQDKTVVNITAAEAEAWEVAQKESAGAEKTPKQLAEEQVALTSDRLIKALSAQEKLAKNASTAKKDAAAKEVADAEVAKTEAEAALKAFDAPSATE